MLHAQRPAGRRIAAYEHELGIPGLRCWRLAGYRHLMFYVEREDHVDVWRVLHGPRDLPAWLQDPE